MASLQGEEMSRWWGVNSRSAGYFGIASGREGPKDIRKTSRDSNYSMPANSGEYYDRVKVEGLDEAAGSHQVMDAMMPWS